MGEEAAGEGAIRRNSEKCFFMLVLFVFLLAYSTVSTARRLLPCLTVPLYFFLYLSTHGESVRAAYHSSSCFLFSIFVRALKLFTYCVFLYPRRIVFRKKKKKAWGSSSGGLTAPAAEEPSHRVEASLRGLFRELSAGGESQGSCAADGGARGGDDAPGWERSVEGAGGNGASSASVEALRAALAEISGARFGVGKMDDAAEAMETILG